LDLSIGFGEVILRIAAAGMLGGLIGFEREISDQPAGFRTHILVALGAALFTMAGATAFGLPEGSSLIRYDPTRVAAQVVTGIGFLGAGAILRHGLNVRGLTTAASLWVTAAVGTAVGLGYWSAAVATAIATLLALFALKRLEGVVFSRLRGRSNLTLAVGPELRLSEVNTVLEHLQVRVIGFTLEERQRGERFLEAEVRLPSGIDPDVVTQELFHVEGVRGVDWS
jgi:putative Mg2+ transporter-C (MgtC) family protein